MAQAGNNKAKKAKTWRIIKRQPSKLRQAQPFACPFAKHAPDWYAPLVCSCNSYHGFKTIPALVQHITRVHFACCLVCKATTKEECKKIEDWDDFMKWHKPSLPDDCSDADRERYTLCEPTASEEREDRSNPQRMDDNQAKNWQQSHWKTLRKSKRNTAPGGVPRSHGESIKSFNWKRIYKSLFPETTTYPNPYASYLVPRHMVERILRAISPPGRLADAVQQLEALLQEQQKPPSQPSSPSTAVAVEQERQVPVQLAPEAQGKQLGAGGRDSDESAAEAVEGKVKDLDAEGETDDEAPTEAPNRVQHAEQPAHVEETPAMFSSLLDLDHTVNDYWSGQEQLKAAEFDTKPALEGSTLADEGDPMNLYGTEGKMVDYDGNQGFGAYSPDNFPGSPDFIGIGGGR